jgi:PAS domain S-box-containing protein
VGQKRSADAEIEAESDRFLAYFQQATYGIFVADGDARIREVNAAACQLTGYSEEELLNLTVPELHPPGLAEDIRIDFEELRTRGFIRKERPFTGKDGRSGWFLVNAVKMSDDRFLGYVSNVTRLKEAEDALAVSEERLRLFVVHVPAGVAMLDCEMRYIACSRRWLSDYGLEGQDIIGRCHYDVFPEISDDWKQIHQRCLGGKSERCEEDVFRRQDGSVQYLKWEIQPWLDSSGDVGGIVMFTEEITERVLGEQALKSSERQLAEAQEVAHLGNWVWEIAQDTITWSDEVYRIFGQEPQSFVPRYERDFLAAVHPDDREKVTSAVGASLERKIPYSVDHRVVRPDGTERMVHEQGRVESDAEGNPVRMFGVVHDITDRVQADEQLNELREQLAHASRVGTMGELASGIAHELNQPLTAIHLQAHTAKLLAGRIDSDVGKKLQDALELIGEQSLRAGEIVRRMRSFIRQQVPQCEECVLADLLNGVLKLMQNELRLHTVTCDVQVSPQVPVLCIDQVQIQQVLVNLIQNAIDAMSAQEPDQRRLSIRIDLRDQLVAVRVADTGFGMTPEVAEQVFDAFHTTKESGLGLGLAICRNLIEAHGGTISACPGADGGAVFEFCLPAAEDKQAGCLPNCEC